MRARPLSPVILCACALALAQATVSSSWALTPAQAAVGGAPPPVLASAAPGPLSTAPASDGEDGGEQRTEGTQGGEQAEPPPVLAASSKLHRGWLTTAAAC